ncbi:MAG TPA: hypothetical protein VFW29_03125 [Solirubrobacteraceae bacterium]|nr:hypothetical protein [Solirubrobacteraceae bacterium]
MDRRRAVERRLVVGGRRRLLLPALAVVALLLAALGGGAAPAQANIHKEFEEAFSHCPIGNPEVVVCLYSLTTSGEFHLGSSTVPVNKTVVLQGGLKKEQSELVPAEGGDTLSKTPLELPGGLTGLPGIGNLNEVNTVAELAGPVNVFLGAFGTREGTAVSLPVKAKLENPSLGETCYIGSDTEPISLQLTTGTTSPPGPNTPIEGSAGSVAFAGGGKINVFQNTSLVDNSFAAPEARGCAEPLSAVVDPAVNLKAGLPAASGKNTAILSGSTLQSGAAVVRHELPLPELGRCVKETAEKVGRTLVYHGLYEGSGCTFETPQLVGKNEWVPGLTSNHFTGSGKTASLETFGKKKIVCTETSAAGEFTGPKTASMNITLSGCSYTAFKESCHSEGQGAGVISIPGVSATTGFIEDVKEETGVVAKLGYLLQREGPSFISATCGAVAEAVNVTGSVIAPITNVNKMGTTLTIAPKQKLGAQLPESFEGEPKNILHARFGGGTEEQAGLQASIKLTLPEKAEYKASVE